MGKKEGSLSDWIKSEESHGYSEKDVYDYLLAKGYTKSQIDDAISEVHPSFFSIKSFISNIGILPVVFFFLSLLLFIIDSFKTAIWFFIALLFMISFFSFFKKKAVLNNHEIISMILISFSSLFLFVFSIFSLMPEFMIVSFFLLGFSFISIFRKKTKKFERYLILFLSLFYSLAAQKIIGIIYDWSLISLPFNLIFLWMRLFLQVIIFFFCLFFSYHQLKKRNFKEEYNKKNLITKSIILSFALSLIFVLGSFYTVYNFSKNNKSKIYESMKDILKSKEQAGLHRYTNMILAKNLSEKTLAEPYIEISLFQSSSNGNLNYMDSVEINKVRISLGNEKINFYYGCDENLECKKTTKSREEKIEDVLKLDEGVYWGIITESRGEYSIYLISRELLQKTYSLFELEKDYAQLKNLEVVKGIDKEYSSIFLDLDNRMNKFINEENNTDFDYIINLKMVEDISGNTIFLTDKGLRFGAVKAKSDSIKEEYPILRYYLDNSISSHAYLEGMKKETSLYLDLFERLKKEEDNKKETENQARGAFSGEESAARGGISILKEKERSIYASKKIFLFVEEAIAKLETDLTDLKEEYGSITMEEYEKIINIQESEESKILRLAAFKKTISDKIFSLLRANHNNEEIIALAEESNLPDICFSLDNTLECLERSINPFNNSFRLSELDNIRKREGSLVKLNKDRLDFKGKNNYLISLLVFNNLTSIGKETFEINFNGYCNNECGVSAGEIISEERILYSKYIDLERGETKAIPLIINNYLFSNCACDFNIILSNNGNYYASANLSFNPILTYQ